MGGLAGASAVGFGTHRWTGSPEQVRALETALDHGCTLLDVAGAGGSSTSSPHVEDVVGRALARRLGDVAVVTTTSLLDPGELARRVRVAAARLRRDRVDVLLLDDLEQLVTRGHHPATSAHLVQQAFVACEQLADHGELGAYGVSTTRPAGTPFDLARLVGLAREVRRDHRFSVLQVPCELLLRRDAGAPDLVRQAHREGVSTIGTRPLPVWPRQGAAPMATCQQYLLDGVDHVVVDPTCEEQVRQVAALLPGRLAAVAGRRAG
ncbi:aldo/keto reductase [Angustibacter peucedani]